MLRLRRVLALPRPLRAWRRGVFQESGVWAEWSDAVRPDVERYWFPRLAALDRRMNEERGGREKCYVLSMFPYPSGRLHMGHLRVYTVTDVLARWQRLQGKFVIQPMGWDAFGLPAENAALERGLEPATWTRDNIAAMRQQLMRMGLSLDWDREIATCDPDYFRWTQWLFLQLHRHGLTYRRRAEVNWDPVDRTVLADEQVDEEGRSWRSGAKVERRRLRQWFFRTTAYSQSLLDGLRLIEGGQWRDVVRRQRGWIGALTGTRVELPLRDARGGRADDCLSVFSESPELLFGAAFVQVGAESGLAEGGEERLLAVAAEHPLTGQPLPVVFSPQLAFRAEDSRDARLGVPGACEEDAEIARRFALPAPAVLDDEGRLVNSGELNGMTREDARAAALALLRRSGAGGHLSSPLRADWLVSRQRAWGTPIPVVHCAACGAVPVPEAELPVLPPGPGQDRDAWRHCACPRCSAPAERETDTMDTFVDSAWYFLRFLDPRNPDRMVGEVAARELMPVDIYVGGIEHAIRHLFYARFIAHFLHDIGLLPQKEPFVQFLPVGLVMGKTFQVQRTGKYLRAEAVTRHHDGTLTETASGEAVEEFWDKMSKSKHNGTDPEEVISRLGVESTRLSILANTGPHKGRKWEEDAVVVGVANWQRRLWTLVGDLVRACDGKPLPPLNPEEKDPLAEDAALLAARDKCLVKVARNLEETFVVSTALASLQILTDRLLKVPPDARRRSAVFAESVCHLVVLLSPLAPMFSSELWSGLQWSLAARAPPAYDLTRPVQMQRFPWPDARVQAAEQGRGKRRGRRRSPNT